jgi:heterodisulfide reductase subunit A-like polyferredoxin
VVVCPTNAMDIREYSNDQVDAMLEAAARWS